MGIAIMNPNHPWCRSEIVIVNFIQIHKKLVFGPELRSTMGQLGVKVYHNQMLKSGLDI